MPHPVKTGTPGGSHPTNHMTDQEFSMERDRLLAAHERLIARPNERLPESNGWFHRYRYPVLTAAHAPVFWRYDLDRAANPFLMERLGINAAFNVGAMEWRGGVVLMADRKSTRLNSSHLGISYAVFCLKKKK